MDTLHISCQSCHCILEVELPPDLMQTTVHVRCGNCKSILSCDITEHLLEMAQVSVDLPSTQEGRRHSNASFSSVEGFEEFEKEERLSGGSGKEHSEHGKAPKNKEKKPRAPSPYNNFIKDQVPKLKAANPGINHKEAFRLAALKWGSSSLNPRAVRDGQADEQREFLQGLREAGALRNHDFHQPPG